MNYKQMVLLEELIRSLTDDEFRMVFLIDNRYCRGEFRRKKAFGYDEDKHRIDTEKLVADYEAFMQEDQEYFQDLADYLERDVEFKGEVMINSAFNHMVVFVMEKENHLDDYLTGYGGPERIYNFYKMTEHYESFLVNGQDMEPHYMFKVPEEEEQDNAEISTDDSSHMTDES